MIAAVCLCVLHSNRSFCFFAIGHISMLSFNLHPWSLLRIYSGAISSPKVTSLSTKGTVASLLAMKAWEGKVWSIPPTPLFPLFPATFCLPHFQKNPLASGVLVSSSATDWTQTLARHFAKGIWRISLILSCSSLSSLLVKINFSPVCDGHLSLLICLAICEPAW